MVRRNYEALVSGDGACAGCGEKSILRAVRFASPKPTCARSITRKPTAFARKADRLENEGAAQARRARRPAAEAEYQLFRRAFAHVVMGLGGENDDDTAKRIADYEAKHGADHRRADRSADSSP